jgi:MerR family transcriptional regulator, redox-sensitive transcriptional activator SoxR
MIISEVAARTGLQPSAIRYYEREGLLTPPVRSGGRRIYQTEVLQRLSMICFAKELGFSLDEIKVLIKEFPENAKASPRWNQLALSKIQEMQIIANKARAVQRMLEKTLQCQCMKLEDCAESLNRAGQRAILQQAQSGLRLQAKAKEQHPSASRGRGRIRLINRGKWD